MRMQNDMASCRRLVAVGAMSLGALLCLRPVGAALAQTRVIAGSVSAAPGTTAAVPISLVLPAGTPCATMQFKLTVVAGSGAPPVETDVSFSSAVGQANENFNHGPDTVLVGWFSSFRPLLTGAVQVGTLNVPISADARTGDTYAVTVFNPSGTTDTETDLPMGSVNGVIAVGEENAPAAGGGGAPIGGAGGAPPPVAEGGGNVAPAPAPPVQPKAGAGAPIHAPLGAAPTEGVPEINKPLPAASAPVPPATAAVVAEAAAGGQPPTGATPPSGAGQPPEAAPPAGESVAAPTLPPATNTVSERPSPTVKRAAPAQAVETPAQTGGCHCQLDTRANSLSALLLLPVVALLGLRRRHRD